MSKGIINEELHLRILILEDSKMDYLIIREMLTAAGYKFTDFFVSNEISFAKILKEQQFDLILSDFSLPGFNAFGALELKQEICPQTPFICVSGSIGEETAIELLMQGADDYVLKDRPERLPFAIKRALDETREKLLRKKVQDDLNANYSLLRIAGNTAKIGGWSVDLKTNVVKWSDTVADIHEMPHGYSPLVNEGIEFYAPDWREIITRVFTACATEGIPYDEEMQIITAAGNLVWVRTIGEAVRDDEGNIVKLQGAIQDISEKKRNEKAIIVSEAKFRNLFERHAAVKFIIDPDDGSIVEANFAAAAFYGWTIEELTKKNLSEINTLPQEKIKQLMGEALSQQNVHHEFRHRKADGTVADVEVFVSTVDISGEKYLHAIVHDITEKKRAESLLIQNEMRYRTIFESANDAIMILKSGRFITCNEKTFLLFGCRRDYVLGRRPSQLSPPLQPDGRNSEEASTEKLNAALAGKPQFFEWTHKRKDNSTFIAEINLNKFTVEKEDFILALVRDVTERKEAELKIRQNNERLTALLQIYEQDIDDIKTFLDFALNQALILTGSRFGYIYYYDEEKEQFILNSWYDNVMTDCKVMDPQTCYELQKTGIWGEAVRQRKEIIVNDFQKENPLKKGYPEGHVRIKKYMTIPVFDQKKIVAVIGVANKETDYDDLDVVQLRLMMNSIWRIVKRKEAETEMMKLSRAVEQSPVSIVVTDHDGIIEYINPKFTQITGYSSAEVIGKNPRILKSGYSSDKFYAELWDTITSGRDWKGEFQNRKKSGELFWESALISPMKNENNNVTNFIAVKEDITEKKKFEVIRRIEYNIAGAILTSKSAAELLGTIKLELEKVINFRNLFVALYDNNTDLFKSVYWSDVKDRYEQWKAEGTLSGIVVKESKPLFMNKAEIQALMRERGMRPTGSEAEYWMGIPLKIRGAARGIIVAQSYEKTDNIADYAKDAFQTVANLISLYLEKKQYEEELVAAKEAAEEMNRVKSIFFANMSHELRTPFVAILGYSELLHDTLADKDDLEMVDGIISASKRMQTTLSKILDLSKLESRNFTMKLKLINVNGLLADLKKEFTGGVLQKGIKLSFKINFTDLRIETDEWLLVDILHNLLSNAIVYTEKGYVELAADTGKRGERNYLIISVSDTGIGIPEDKQDLIWDAFRQVSEGATRQFQGTGLGLSIVKKSVELLGGKISLKSKLGEGSVFTIEIPF